MTSRLHENGFRPKGKAGGTEKEEELRFSLKFRDDEDGPVHRSKTNVTEAIRGSRVLASGSCSVEAEGGPQHQDREGGCGLHATGATENVGNIEAQGEGSVAR